MCHGVLWRIQESISISGSLSDSEITSFFGCHMDAVLVAITVVTHFGFEFEPPGFHFHIQP